MNWNSFMPWVIGFGLLVVVPIVALISETIQKKSKSNVNSKEHEELLQRVKTLETTIESQQKQIEDMKELLHVNILKMDDFNHIQSRIGSKDV